MSRTQTDHIEIARRHGVALSDVRIPTKDERLRLLTACLQRTDVPFPISPASAQTYLRQAERGEPFRVGPFSSETVDLHRYANAQEYDQYSFEEHLSWACLIADQQHTKHQFACREYLEGERLFEIGGNVIPDFYLLNARIYQQTCWQLATVNMIIPAELFFTCHSRRFFPVTTFMRPLETDYLQEPDIGHDVAGHVATFTIPAVANVMKNHGLARDMIYALRDQQLEGLGELSGAARDKEAQRIQSEAEQLLNYAGRIYWFMVEFGLVWQEDQLRCFGAGILSSPGETTFSVTSPASNRILVDPSSDQDLLRMANTDYLISEYQKTYFISKSFQLLDTITPERVLQAAQTAMQLPDFTWRELVPGDQVVDVGTVAMSPNEKYYRLMAGQPMDECLTRSAIKNLRMELDGYDRTLLRELKQLPPSPPEAAIRWFEANRAICEARYRELVASTQVE
jgi:phenylalanine-4-hydroxylase